jgi:hypothetical protein
MRGAAAVGGRRGFGVRLVKSGGFVKSLVAPRPESVVARYLYLVARTLFLVAVASIVEKNDPLPPWVSTEKPKRKVENEP